MDTRVNTRSHLRQLLPTIDKARLPLIPSSVVPSTEPHHTIRSTHSTTSVTMPSITAATFARDAPKAGFLYKEGKRRFFVLKSTTCLYYFLSASDHEPRGCIDLESGSGVTLRETQSTVNGRLGFEIHLPTQEKDLPPGGVQPTIIRLEAEDETAAREWMHLITVERLSHSKSVVESLSAKVAALENDKKDLYRLIDTFHLVEQDRDGAIQDAQDCKRKLEQFNQGLDMLRACIVEDTTSCHWMHETRFKTAHTGHDESALSQYIQENNLQSSNLNTLSHCYQNLKAKINNEYQLCSTVKRDLHEAQETVTELRAKLLQAEEKMSKLYEENLDLRENLKQTKKERKILAQEFRSLRNVFTVNEEENESLRKKCEELNSTLSSLKLESGPINAQENNFSNRRKQLATPDKRLFFELEESVTSSLLLNEQFLASGNPDNNILFRSEKVLNPHKPSDTSEVEDDGNDISISSDTPHEIDKDVSVSSQSVSPLRPKILACRGTASRLNTSLLDYVVTDTSDDSSNDQQIHNINIPDAENDGNTAFQEKEIIIATIDDENGTSTASTIPCDSSAQSSNMSNRSLVTSNGEATAKLICPFVDVTETRSRDDCQLEQLTPDRGQVYHLTFYGSKIGLQFQKVPAESFNNGKLADAMRADLFDEGKQRSHMELEKVRTIAQFNSKDNVNICPSEVESLSPVVYPNDIVLVCGFHGFDELSNSNRRPHLGARLIAFDGISVEVGPWTFDTIRKSIQARGRPITLSFRNEYLSTNQRSILTKAVRDVNASIPQQEHLSQYKIPEITTTLNSHTMQRQLYDDTSISTSSFHIPHRTDDHSDAESSITESASSPRQSRKSGSFLKRKAVAKTWKSFSEVGSSTSSSKFTAKFGPMMSNIVSTFNANKESVQEPEYLSRIPNYVESKKQHQDYRATLL